MKVEKGRRRISRTMKNISALIYSHEAVIAVTTVFFIGGLFLVIKSVRQALNRDYTAAIYFLIWACIVKEFVVYLQRVE